MPPRGDTQRRAGLCMPGLAQALPEQATESRHHPSPRGCRHYPIHTCALRCSPPAAGEADGVRCQQYRVVSRLS